MCVMYMYVYECDICVSVHPYGVCVVCGVHVVCMCMWYMYMCVVYVCDVCLPLEKCGLEFPHYLCSSNYSCEY